MLVATARREDLAALAADIGANGLKVPLLLDSEGALVDGRNRLRACILAGVEPRFETLPKEADLIGEIISRNVHHRFLSKGQRAMAAAIGLAEKEKAAE